MDTEPSGSNNAAMTHRVGQACDRCRKKKIKCDGAFPICRSCEKGGYICEVSATLRRKTKVRGFTSTEQRLEELQAELARCQQLLQSEHDRNNVLQQQISRAEETRIPEDTTLSAGSASKPESAFQSGRQQSNDPTYTIKHMGRLVHDENSIGRFAGSTTGVHFVLEVEKVCQKSLSLTSNFPESCFSLFLAQPFLQYPKIPMASPLKGREQLSRCFAYSLSYYYEQAEVFMKDWEPFCPILVRVQLRSDINCLMEALHDPTGTADVKIATVVILLMILSINDACSDRQETTYHLDSNHQHHLSIASEFIDELATKGDIKSLQALVLFALYHQLTGQCFAMTRMNGVMVSLAQSLGLHRHARRFKMKPGEIELRKRLWWWIYNFDRMVSLLHGLPSLINDNDVDNDLPVDCHLLDLDAAELTHPLPGENTAVLIFIQYVQIGKILSRIRQMLYTTTQRRNGAAKIKELDFDLRMWNQNLKLNGIHFDIGAMPEASAPGDPVYPIERTTLWLQLLANVAMVLVHRPGLSFDESTAEFSNCLRVCVASSSANLSLLGDPNAPLWLQNLSLMDPGMLFQSALMHVYCQCHSRALNIEGCPSLNTSLDMISKGAMILQKTITTPRLGYTPQAVYSEPINEAIGTLQLLQSLLQTRHLPAETAPIMGHSMEGETPELFDENSWNPNALDALNYVTATDWMHEVPGPFMGFMGLGG